MSDMLVVSLNPYQVALIRDAMGEAQFEVLVAVDLLDRAFKVKIDGGIWSPPMGVALS